LLTKRSKAGVPRFLALVRPNVAMDLVVRFASQEFSLHCGDDQTVGGLKLRLQALTKVEAGRQKLVGLPPKAADASLLCDLKGLKPKLMLIGTPSEAASAAAAAEAAGVAASAAVADDLDLAADDLKSGVRLHEDPVYIERVNNRAAKYEPLRLQEPRGGAVSRLLVLDVDYTLFDHRSPAEKPMDLARPHLHEFLAAAYQLYEIIIWSATSMK
jgi:ubiquitin-like domain-containing CTD phosphatase 1